MSHASATHPGLDSWCQQRYALPMLQKKKYETSKTNSNAIDEGISKTNSFSHKILNEVCLQWVSILIITTITCQSIHMQANTSTTEYTCNIGTFVLMLYQVSAGTCFNRGREASFQVYRYCSTDWTPYMSPKCGLGTWYTTASVGHLRISLKALFYDWWILHESTNSSAPNNYIPWRSFHMQLVNVTILILGFFLVQIGMYKGHGWLQAMQPPFSYASSTSGEISPS